ncbi:MAG: malonyl-CoA/methylmalonyl-CoA synthetase [Solirubrobacteraceae bacterium]|jgi:acyl-coenzyme A synthetase/AMP-(fatty) acid ligase|nr:malonyl-CoA/methylmalonyl-CoA synthetase [Solirubrobacteraceae bacterium]
MTAVRRMLPPIAIDGHHVDEHLLDGAVRATIDALGDLRLSTGSTFTAAPDSLSVIVGLAAAQITGASLALAPADAGRFATPRLEVTASGRVDLARGPSVRVPAQTAVLFFTSGTDATPKVVAISRAGLEHQAAATAERLAVAPGERLLLPLPIWHAYGFSVLLMARHAGAHVHIEHRVAPIPILRRLAERRYATLDGFPGLYRKLLVAARDDPERLCELGRLRVRGCGGDVLAPALQDAFVDAVGAPIHDGYGLSEAGPNVALSGPGDNRIGTVGRPLDGVQVRVAADGEIHVRSPSVALGGYDADDPAVPLPIAGDDGWLQTGDLGSIDADGFLRVTGRKKHVIMVYGEAHSPVTIEQAALTVEDVAEAVAVGRAGEHERGDAITLFVAGASRPTGALRDAVAHACAMRLLAALRPHDIHVVEALPQLHSGKPDRSALRSLAAESRQR